MIQDETDLLLFPPLRSGWARKGEAAVVVLSGFNARRVIFGAMNLRSGQRLFVVRERQRSPDFQVFLKALRKQYGDRPVALLLDEDPSHTAKGVDRVGGAVGHRVAVAAQAFAEVEPDGHIVGASQRAP